MKAIQVKCPHCNAQLRADETTQMVTCEYCGTASQIQRRTRILERVQLPAQINPAMRYAVQSHSSGWKWMVLAIVFIPVLITVIVIVSVVSRVRQTVRVEIPKEITAAFGSNGIKIDMSGGGGKNRGPSWQGTDSVLVADVDGDGVPELIGRGRQVQVGDSIRLLALDLATGRIKWQSEPIGTYSDTYTGPLSIAGDLVVHANNSGTIQAFAVKDGARTWKATQDERVAAFCLDGDNLVAVGADDMLRTYARADGAVVGTPKAAPGKGKASWDKKDPCSVLPNDDQTAFQRVEDSRHSRYNQYRIDGNKHDLAVDHAIDGPDGGRVLGGTRKEGTNVTTIVAVDAKNTERWRATAAAEALTATGGPRHIVVGERETCIIYYSNTYRTACFAMADGKRLWDIESPSFAEGLLIIGRFLVMTTARNIEVHDVETGVEKWTSSSWD